LRAKPALRVAELERFGTLATLECARGVDAQHEFAAPRQRLEEERLLHRGRRQLVELDERPAVERHSLRIAGGRHVAVEGELDSADRNARRRERDSEIARLRTAPTRIVGGAARVEADLVVAAAGVQRSVARRVEVDTLSARGLRGEFGDVERRPLDLATLAREPRGPSRGGGQPDDTQEREQGEELHVGLVDVGRMHVDGRPERRITA